MAESFGTLWADEATYGAAAQRMVQTQLRRRGINDARVLRQMRSVPRHVFVNDSLKHRAYDDSALPTRNSQTISQPYIVALMCELLEVEPHHRVLEIGTGSGYQTAILAQLGRAVVSIERDEALAEQGRAAVAKLGIDNVTVHAGDGTLGWPDAAPFDRIIVTAGAPRICPALTGQLADNGKLVIPVGDWQAQQLAVVDRAGDQLHTRHLLDCRFVPLVGQQGW